MEKKSFLFYKSWKSQLDLLDNNELRSFIEHLFKYHDDSDEGFEYVSDKDKLVWYGVLPALEINKKKYEDKVKASSVNGKKGGAPKGNDNAKKK